MIICFYLMQSKRKDLKAHITENLELHVDMVVMALQTCSDALEIHDAILERQSDRLIDVENQVCSKWQHNALSPDIINNTWHRKNVAYPQHTKPSITDKVEASQHLLINIPIHNTKLTGRHATKQCKLSPNYTWLGATHHACTMKHDSLTHHSTVRTTESKHTINTVCYNTWWTNIEAIHY